MNEIHSIMGEKHTTQILCVLDALGADWMKVEDFYMSELERGAKNIFTGQPLTAEQAADELWAALHRMAERLWLRSITREQAEAMESTAGQAIGPVLFGFMYVRAGLPGVYVDERMGSCKPGGIEMKKLLFSR